MIMDSVLLAININSREHALLVKWLLVRQLYCLGLDVGYVALVWVEDLASNMIKTEISRILIRPIVLK